jgi:uncharacterized protein YjbI with pentapeptide repeats
MRFFFRRSTGNATPAASNAAGTTTAELPAPIEQSRADDSRGEEVPHPFQLFAPKKELVHASELPSAANVLAELFSDQPVKSVSEEQTLHTVAHVEPKHVANAAERGSKRAEEEVAETKVTEVVQKIAASIPILTAPERRTLAPEKPPAPVQPAAFTDRAADSDPSPPAKTDNDELCPEDAATVLAAASEELRSDDTAASSEQSGEPSDPTGIRIALPLASSNWKLEEVLAAHREWVESKGARGKKADLANAQLDAIELINVNLRLADLHYANLKSTDLLLADLRDACMVRADLEEACLVGANLEGANLEGASLETALGLVPRQLAGTNLREASLPAQIAQFPAAAIFHTAARTALQFFAAMTTLSVVSALAIWKTKDIQLVTDSAFLPFLHSAKAAAAMPAAQIFLITPVALFLLYLAFLQQIQRVWAAALELPAVFPDGSTLGEKESGIIVGLLRAHFRWMNQDAPSARTLETTVSLLLAYWTVPIMLFLFWARYLTVQEIHGTILHELLASVAAGVALHATFKVGRPQEKWAMQRTFMARISERLRHSRPPVLVGILLAIATFISFGTIAGAPHDRARAPQYGPANFRRWAPIALWSVGYDPYADLTEGTVSIMPTGWNGSDDQVSSVRGAHLNNPRFRYAQAYRAFFANAHLWHADFRGAYLSDSDLRAADLTQSNFQFAVMDGVRMNHANLDRAILDDTHLARADFRDANLSYVYLANAFLMDARFDGASLYDAQLSNSTLVRTAFERADLRNAHIDAANLEHADLRQAYLWSASVQNSDMKDADLGSAILIGANLRGSNLSGAHFAQTVLTETDLTGTILDGADMRGAFGLTAYQVCSARSYAGASFDDALLPQIQTRCPTSH